MPHNQQIQPLMLASTKFDRQLYFLYVFKRMYDGTGNMHTSSHVFEEGGIVKVH